MGKRKRRTKSRSDSEASSSKRSKKSKTKITIKKKRKNWSVDLDKRFRIMKAAVEDVIEKKMTIRKAAEKWGVKRSTLADRVSGRVDLGRRSGPPSILTRAEEQMLAEWILNMAQRGYGFKKHKLLKTVKKILDKDKRTTMLKRNMPGNKWFRQFVMRNPRVRVVTSNQQLQKTGILDKTSSKQLGTDYERFNTIVSAYHESESTSEGDSETDSEVESGSGSEAEDIEEVEEESQPESPVQNDYNSEVVIESEPVLKLELEPNLELEPVEESHPESSVPKTEVVVESEPVPEVEPELGPEVEPELNQDSEPHADVVVGSKADLANQEDFKVDHSPSPDISVANTVTITTTE